MSKNAVTTATVSSTITSTTTAMCSSSEAVVYPVRAIVAVGAPAAAVALAAVGFESLTNELDSSSISLFPIPDNITNLSALDDF